MKTEREKIAQIVAEYLCPQGKAHKTLYGEERMCYSRDNFAECEKVSKCVDALIAAGIGDVSEYKHRAEVVEKEREEYRNSNRIVLRGIEIIKRNILRYCATDFPTILQQAEKELQEEGKSE